MVPGTLIGETVRGAVTAETRIIVAVVSDDMLPGGGDLPPRGAEYR